MSARSSDRAHRMRPSDFGIRARLLALLLPSVLALLAFDSWNDYRALEHIVQDAYDQALLEPVQALNNSMTVAVDGTIRIDAPFAAQALFNEMQPGSKHLHLELVALAAGADDAVTSAGSTRPKTSGQATTSMGVNDLPPVPRSTGQSRPDHAAPVWYDGVYRGHAVRVVALRRSIVDGQGIPYQLLIQAAASTGPRDAAVASTLRQELRRDARMLAAVILLVWLGVGWSLWPLERLRKSVLASPPDALGPLDPAQVPHEVRPLVEAVNHHMASHREVLAKQAEFLADASHQLRTPLAILLTQAACALREPDIGRIRETLRAIVAQLSRSRRLSEQLLALAHASELPPGDAPAALVDLNLLGRRVVLQYLALAHDRNQDLGWVPAYGETLSAEGGATPVELVAPVVAHGEELYEVLANLVHNAVVYTPVGGTITVTTGLENQSVWVEICDDGPGIAAAQRAAVFERFVQLAGPARSGAACHGAGLGLAIAKRYAEHNGGAIELADATPDADRSGGLRAILRLPRAGLADQRSTPAS